MSSTLAFYNNKNYHHHYLIQLVYPLETFTFLINNELIIILNIYTYITILYILFIKEAQLLYITTEIIDIYFSQIILLIIYNCNNEIIFE